MIHLIYDPKIFKTLGFRNIISLYLETFDIWIKYTNIYKYVKLIHSAAPQSQKQ